MADTFTVVTQYPTVEYLGGSKTQDVMAIGIVTKPSGIYTEFRVPQSIYSHSIVNATALGYANIYETAAGLDWVEGVQWSQVPSNGQLADQITFTVVSTSGNSSAQLSVLVLKLGPQLHQPQITALHNQLDAAEDL